MRYLYTLNAGEKGSARTPGVPGYALAARPEQPRKVINGRYSKELNFNTFVAHAFLMDDPQYLVLRFADAPHPEKPGMTGCGLECWGYCR
jgi:cell division protein FtsI (penicillin-binding protein 3)